MSTLGDKEKSVRLRALIRARLTAGTLPRRAGHHRVYAGYGEDQVCSACGQPIGSSDVLYEIDAALPAAQFGADSMHAAQTAHTAILALHLECFELWAAESRAGPESPSSTLSDAMPRLRSVCRR